MATFELYRRSTIGTCLTETLDELVSSGAVSPELAIQVLVQFDKSMTDALESQVKSKVNIKDLFCLCTGPSAHLQVLRQCLDLHSNRCNLQERGDFRNTGQGEDRGLRFQVAAAPSTINGQPPAPMIEPRPV
ncbi:unnamed protein product [Urochloa decumbens]|uniref:Transcription initiation factor IIA gamma subunit N-terminal domain-containing protein n=1 Tax=Urochloa decumbens TaxID=240449 RepID=A0ABC9EKP2_9POAL